MTRTRAEIEAEAKSLTPIDHLYLTPDEFKLLAREIGLAFKFAGRRVVVVPQKAA
jgi:hypothetical protein